MQEWALEALSLLAVPLLCAGVFSWVAADGRKRRGPVWLVGGTAVALVGSLVASILLSPPGVFGHMVPLRLTITAMSILPTAVLIELGVRERRPLKRATIAVIAFAGGVASTLTPLALLLLAMSMNPD